MYNRGISTEGDVIDLAADKNIVEKSGAWYAYNGAKIAQGREAAKQYLVDHPDVMAELDQKVRALTV
jgi:recombination protein RecA